ncbi:biotin carboxyl carrier protein [Calothrix sp. PCC 6303]|nr:biotin carboxyl carrier protein [Calothrix sp. PCC 6303]
MSTVPLDFNEIRQLLVTIAQTDIAEVTLKSDDLEISVRKTSSVTHPAIAVVQGGKDSSGLILNNTPTTPQVEQTTLIGATPHPVVSLVSTPGGQGLNPGNAFAGGQSGNPPSAMDSKLVEVTSPMVGTFYRAPAPGEAPFIEIGGRIRKGDAVCIIEAMKLMNEIEAEVSGQVMEILVQNGEPVEYGQPLMRVNPG